MGGVGTNLPTTVETYPQIFKFANIIILQIFDWVCHIPHPYIDALILHSVKHVKEIGDEVYC